MPLSEVSLGAIAPPTDEIVVKRSRERRTQKRDHSCGHFFCQFSTYLNGHALNNARHKARDYFLLEQFLAQVHTRGARRGNPDLRRFLIACVFEAMNEAQLLNHAEGNRAQDADIGHDGEYSTDTETRAFAESELHGD